MAEKTETKKPEVEHVEVTPVENNAIELMERASIDVQIATAHRFPRDVDRFIEKAKKMVAIDEETATSCIYRRPVGREDGGVGQKFVSGESIRLAEIVASCYGNLRVGVIISEINPRYVKAIGYAHDLESNFAGKAETVESTVTKYGKPYSERMRLVVAKAAQSKARRDAIFQVVPKSLCKPIIEKARQIIAGNQKPLNERREAVKVWMSKLSIEDERIFTALGVKGLNNLGDDELETLTGIRTALKEGDITLDEAFPPLNLKETEQNTQNKIKQEAGSENVDVKQPKTKKKQKKKTAKKKKKAKSLYACNKGHEFDEPKTSGPNGEVLICPECLTADIRKTDEQGDKPEFMNDD